MLRLLTNHFYFPAKNYIKVDKDIKFSVENQDLVQVLQMSTMTELQTKGNHLLNGLIKCNTNPENLVDVITSMLKNSAIVKSENAFELNKNGLLIDWLADIDSELIFSTKSSLDVMFNRSLPQFRFYLLSLLSHQASGPRCTVLLVNCLERIIQTMIQRR